MALSLNPNRMRRSTNRSRIEPDCWYYEERYGLHVMHEPSPYFKDAVIPVAQIRRYLHRLDSKNKDGK